MEERQMLFYLSLFRKSSWWFLAHTWSCFTRKSIRSLSCIFSLLRHPSSTIDLQSTSWIQEFSKRNCCLTNFCICTTSARKIRRWSDDSVSSTWSFAILKIVLHEPVTTALSSLSRTKSPSLRLVTVALHTLSLAIDMNQELPESLIINVEVVRLLFVPPKAKANPTHHSLSDLTTNDFNNPFLSF